MQDAQGVCRKRQSIIDNGDYFLNSTLRTRSNASPDGGDIAMSQNTGQVLGICVSDAVCICTCIIIGIDSIPACMCFVVQETHGKRCRVRAFNNPRQF